MEQYLGIDEYQYAIINSMITFTPEFDKKFGGCHSIARMIDTTVLEDMYNAKGFFPNCVDVIMHAGFSRDEATENARSLDQLVQRGSFCTPLTKVQYGYAPQQI